MRRFRGLFIRYSLLSTAVLCLLILPFNLAAATGVLVGSAASFLAMLWQIFRLGLAETTGIGIKSSVYTGGVLRLAVYAAAFYVAYEIGDARGAALSGVLGAAGGLQIPLAVVAGIGLTCADLDETAG